MSPAIPDRILDSIQLIHQLTMPEILAARHLLHFSPDLG
jgi:hypothetical protein